MKFKALFFRFASITLYNFFFKMTTEGKKKRIKVETHFPRFSSEGLLSGGAFRLRGSSDLFSAELNFITLYHNATGPLEGCACEPRTTLTH